MRYIILLFSLLPFCSFSQNKTPHQDRDNELGLDLAGVFQSRPAMDEGYYYALFDGLTFHRQLKPLTLRFGVGYYKFRDENEHFTKGNKFDRIGYFQELNFRLGIERKFFRHTSLQPYLILEGLYSWNQAKGRWASTQTPSNDIPYEEVYTGLGALGGAGIRLSLTQSVSFSIETGAQWLYSIEGETSHFWYDPVRTLSVNFHF